MSHNQEQELNSQQTPIPPKVELETSLPLDTNNVDSSETIETPVSDSPEIETQTVPTEAVAEEIVSEESPEVGTLTSPTEVTTEEVNPEVSPEIEAKTSSAEVVNQEVTAGLNPEVPASSHDEDGDYDDSEEEETDEEDDSSEEEAVLYSAEELAKMSQEELVGVAKSTVTLTAREALKRLQEIRPVLYDKLREEKRTMLESFVEEGNEPENFVYPGDELRNQFLTIYNLAKESRVAEKNRIDQEKLKNLKAKQALLEKLKLITESDETEQSLAEVKAIQQEWKLIRIIPQDKISELWDAYNYYQNKFYDNHSINIELKELDRKKNLEVKIDLCKKVDELSKENSLKKSFIMLNKFQEEFRNTGPVPREFNQEIWDRFRAACDTVYEQKKVLFEQFEGERIKNYELKEVLVEKAALIAAQTFKKVKEWGEKTGELDALMTEWKTIGQVPKNKNEKVWKEFRTSFNTFYGNKSEYFKQIHKERKANLILKEDIVKRAEELKDSEDLVFATKELIKLQKEWKEIGPVPDKVSNALWKKFRGSCDFFFNRKQKQFEGKKEEETENLNRKKVLVERLKTMVETEAPKSILDDLKAIQREWSSIGYVPFKAKKQIETDYQNSSNEVFNKFKLDRQELKSGQAKEHFKNMSALPNGENRLKDEAYKIQKKITFLKSEISTLDNNMEFFGRSAGAQKLKQSMQEKIDKTNAQIGRLQAEIKVIKNIGKSNQAEESNAAKTEE